MSETVRIEKARQEYINLKPSICCERARIWTQSHKETEASRCHTPGQGLPGSLQELPVNILKVK